jgi:hypothetical protein
MVYQIQIQNFEGDFSPVGGECWLADVRPYIEFPTLAEAQNALDRELRAHDDMAAREYWRILKIP